jgi:hypothetical protein
MSDYDDAVDDNSFGEDPVDAGSDDDDDDDDGEEPAEVRDL